VVLRVLLVPQALKESEVQTGLLVLRALQELQGLRVLKGHKVWLELPVRMDKMGRVLTKWR
jgi:hypothetical protein